MNKKRNISELSIQYNMHIEHINHARSHFEQEMKEFIGEVNERLLRIISEQTEERPFISVRNIILEEKPKTTVNTSFWVNLNAYILAVKKDAGKRSTGIGYFNTGIYYDYDLKTFVWYASFNNLNKVSDQIDEICHKNIEQMKVDVEIFKNSSLLKNDEVFFFKHPLDDKFGGDIYETIKRTIDVLFESIEESGNVKLREDFDQENEEKDINLNSDITINVNCVDTEE